MSDSEYQQLRLLIIGLSETILKRVAQLEMRVRKIEERDMEHRPTEPPDERTADL